MYMQEQRNTKQCNAIVAIQFLQYGYELKLMKYNVIQKYKNKYRSIGRLTNSKKQIDRVDTLFLVR